MNTVPRNDEMAVSNSEPGCTMDWFCHFLRYTRSSRPLEGVEKDPGRGEGLEVEFNP